MNNEYFQVEARTSKDVNATWFILGGHDEPAPMYQYANSMANEFEEVVVTKIMRRVVYKAK